MPDGHRLHRRCGELIHGAPLARDGPRVEPLRGSDRIDGEARDRVCTFSPSYQSNSDTIANAILLLEFTHGHAMVQSLDIT